MAAGEKENIMLLYKSAALADRHASGVLMMASVAVGGGFARCCLRRGSCLSQSAAIQKNQRMLHHTKHDGVDHYPKCNYCVLHGA